MDFLRTNILNILIFIVLVAGGGGAYYYFFGADSGDLLTSQTQPGGEVAGELLTLLSEVPALNIDENIFSQPVFQALKDFSVPVPDELVGRPNPFAPLSAPRTTGRPSITITNPRSSGAAAGRSATSPAINTNDNFLGLDESLE